MYNGVSHEASPNHLVAAAQSSVSVKPPAYRVSWSSSYSVDYVIKRRINNTENSCPAAGSIVTAYIKSFVMYRHDAKRQVKM